MGALGSEMDRARHQLLAGARFAGDEHAGVGARDLLHDAEDLLDGVAFADDVLEAVFFAQLAAQEAVFLEQRLLRQRVAHHGLEMVVGERLGDVVVGALVQRVHGRFHARVGGHDNAHHLGIEPAHAA